MHLGVAVAVGHIDIPRGRQRGVRAAVKRQTAHIGCGLAGGADLHEDFAHGGAFAHHVAAVVGEV